MTSALYSDMPLSPEQRRRVADYVREVDFHLPGATSEDFEIASHARYLGYLFQAEDLEAYGVGFRCTAPGLEEARTFIRMSRGQLLGAEGAPVLPVNQPVIGRGALTMQRHWESPLGPARHGVDTFAGDEGIPGVDHDLTVLEAQLADILDFQAGRPVALDQEILDLKVNWGTLLAGRYSRLIALESRLSPDQAARLSALRGNIQHYSSILTDLGLPTLETLETTPVVDG